ncbi:hypothetical protein SKAU_G00290760 [Synaphobranchus kaupii]|uniref:Uncharacterized protein n=1 Tax=Synaphobranchus kaupii TaxID=118154 RepID=A0A9Q1ETS3_SYNKA|nr:hypothetical protein SKAU_G00290760 [Synaphobranchus kaupii]
MCAGRREARLAAQVWASLGRGSAPPRVRLICPLINEPVLRKATPNRGLSDGAKSCPYSGKAHRRIAGHRPD